MKHGIFNTGTVAGVAVISAEMAKWNRQGHYYCEFLAHTFLGLHAHTSTQPYLFEVPFCELCALLYLLGWSSP